MSIKRGGIIHYETNYVLYVSQVTAETRPRVIRLMTSSERL